MTYRYLLQPLTYSKPSKKTVGENVKRLNKVKQAGTRKTNRNTDDNQDKKERKDKGPSRL